MIKIRVDAKRCAQCLLCQLMCSFSHNQSFNISQSKINIDIASRKIEFSDECNNCGICVKYCAYGALVVEEQSKESIAS